MEKHMIQIIHVSEKGNWPTQKQLGLIFPLMFILSSLQTAPFFLFYHNAQIQSWVSERSLAFPYQMGEDYAADNVKDVVKYRNISDFRKPFSLIHVCRYNFTELIIESFFPLFFFPWPCLCFHQKISVQLTCPWARNAMRLVAPQKSVVNVLWPHRAATRH